MAAENETTTKFKVDISELKKGIQDAGRQIRLANAEFKAASSGMKNWETSSDGLTAKLNLLKTTLTSQKTILSNLQQQYAAVSAEQGENSAAAQNLAIRINNQQAAINKTESAINDYEGALNTVQQAEAAAAKNGTTVEEELQNIAKAADAADKETTDAANGGFTVLKGALANLAANAVMAAVNGLKELGAAAVNVGKQAIAGYANYEQLAGGVQTLFGAGGKSLEDYAKSVGKSVKDVEGEYNSLMTAQSTVMKNANDAYKNAGLSANDYMKTVTSFSASLISSLGGDTEKAAGVADQAIVDMADNANKMGTSIGDIQNAYQGFAKQNYTMLDNLKLGYGGTKEEMQRLLTDAEALTGKKFDISNFADITEAIHAIQTEMGITGATYEESSKTIEGSINSMKSAWQNFLTGLAAGDEMDLSQLINNLVDSVATVGVNVLPRLNTTIGSMAQAIPVLISKLFPMVLDVINTNLPTIINGGAQVILSLITGILQALPGLTTAAGQIITSLLSTLSSAIPQVITTIINAIPLVVQSLMAALPLIIQACYQFVTAIVSALPDIISSLISALPMVIQSIVTGLVSGVDMLVQGATTLFMAIIDAIPLIVNLLSTKLPSIIDTILTAVTKALPQLLQAAIRLFTEIVNAIPKIIPPLVKALPSIITSIVTTLTNNLPLLLKTAILLFNSLVDALPIIITALTKELPSVISTIVTVLLDNLPTVLQAAITLFMEILKAIPKVAAELLRSMPKIIKSILTGLKDGISSVADIGRNLIRGLWNGISDMAGWIRDKINGFGKGVLDALMKFFGINSPSRVMRDQVGKYLALGIAEGITENQDAVDKAMKAITDDISNPVDFGPIGPKLPRYPSGGVGGAGAIGHGTTSTYTFNQYNTSPKALSRLEIYRQTNNILNYAKGV